MNHITDNIYVGDRLDAQNEVALDVSDIEHVVTVTKGDVPETTTYHPLTDGDNPYSRFEAAVDAAREAVKTGDPTLIHCTVGKSRSPTVVACVIAVRDECSFETALDSVAENRLVNPVPELRQLAERYVQNHTPADD